MKQTKGINVNKQQLEELLKFYMQNGNTRQVLEILERIKQLDS
jgi:hypothetical protein